MRCLGVLFFLCFWSFSLLANDFKPAIIYESNLIMDKSFNESLYNGMELFKKKRGVEYDKAAYGDKALYEKKLRSFVKKGHNPILVPGFSVKEIVEKVAKEFPNTFFVAIDYIIDLPNVYSIVFKEHEGSFLAGIMAAMSTKTKKVGFIGGMDVPVIRRFSFGFEQGVKYVNPDIEVIVDFVTGTPLPWNSPKRGKEITQSQLKKGADVIFPAAGGTGLAVLETAAKANKLGIGVDLNQNHLFPGRVLTSMVKNLDRAVYIALFSYQKNLWTDKVKSLGIAQKGVGVIIDKHNKSLVNDKIQKKLEQAKMEILMGTLVIESDKVGKVGSTSSITKLNKPNTVIVGTGYDDSFPYILGDKNDKKQVDKDAPGLAIDALRILENKIDVKFKINRTPWKRTLSYLKTGNVDALVYTSYQPDYKKYGVFPKKNNKIDEDRRLLTERWYLYKLKSTNISWEGSINKSIGPVGVVVGAGVSKELKKAGLKVEETSTLMSSFKKLNVKRLNTVASVDLNGDFLLQKDQKLFKNVVKIHPELTKKYYYIIFSHQFYKKYPEFSEIMWNTLSSIRESVEFWESTDKYFK